MTDIKEHLLESKMTEIEQARIWSPRVISRFETLVRSGDDLSLYRINPLAFARDLRHIRGGKHRLVSPCDQKRAVRDELGRGVPPIRHGARQFWRLAHAENPLCLRFVRRVR